MGFIKRISSSLCSQYVTLRKYFSHPSFRYVLSFATPPKKLKLGQHIYVGTTNSKTRWTRKHRGAVRSYLLHSFLWQVHSAAAPRTMYVKLCKNTTLSQTGYRFGFSSSIFTLQDHILSTIGDALRVVSTRVSPPNPTEREEEARQNKIK